MVRRFDPAALQEVAFPLRGAPDDYDAVLEQVGDARHVLIGEATHGTHEFYRERALLTRRLILEKGFCAVAIEGDWPDAYRVHRYVTAQGDGSAADALSGFGRFPSWMWRNTDVVDFVGWLRAHNETQTEAAQRVGFYGLDLYSLYASVEAVLAVLDRVDPQAAARARARYACFDHYAGDTRRYGYAAGVGLAESCEREVTQQLKEIVEGGGRWLGHASHDADEQRFHLEQNARLVKNAEEYYRTMFRGTVSTWNLRDRHMMDTLEALTKYLGGRAVAPKVVVWAHNSHVGDARATAMGDAGEWTLGQLAREQEPGAAYLIGFSTYEGTVTAASDWDGAPERKQVRPALPGSHEAVLHASGGERMLLFTNDGVVRAALGEERLERAIGVVYRPESERSSHYFEARITDQFDALIHIDRTRAVEPLESSPRWRSGEVPETYPFAV